MVSILHIRTGNGHISALDGSKVKKYVQHKCIFGRLNINTHKRSFNELQNHFRWGFLETHEGKQSNPTNKLTKFSVNKVIIDARNCSETPLSLHDHIRGRIVDPYLIDPWSVYSGKEVVGSGWAYLLIHTFFNPSSFNWTFFSNKNVLHRPMV